MDLTTAQELRAIKSSKKRSRNFQSLYNLILQILIALACSVLCSCSFWFPLVKQFLLITLPMASSHVLSPKYLFVVANVIVIALVWESKLRGSREPSPSREIYDEYVRRSRSNVRKHPIISSTPKRVQKEEEKLMVIQVEEEKHQVVETMPMDKDVEEKSRFTSEIESCVDMNEGPTDTSTAPGPIGEEKDEDELPDEELNRRVEAFIARVNRQRWLEARSLMNFPNQSASRNMAVCG